MNGQQLADILLHHKQLLWWMKREDRDKELMEIADEIIFSEQMKAVETEMQHDFA